MSLVQKLINIQKELKAPKNQRNNFGKYNYRSCEDILEAVKPLNAEQGLLLTIKDEIEYIDGRHYVKAVCEITDGDSAITSCAYAREADNRKGMDEAQVTGSASSYARKYALNGLYLIDDTKDVDTEAHQKQVDRKQKQSNQQPPKNNERSFGDYKTEVTQKAIKLGGMLDKPVKEIISGTLTSYNKKNGTNYDNLNEKNIQKIEQMIDHMLGKHNGN
ncbi:hypothetical protein B8A42_08720 [Dolosigranulum pigrum]|uniref:ERF family protein n=1 Tax=Dolosigranulum pigrum TaxID=29394 RepID=UPI000DBFCE4C|nr:ERF family protein [Dolosigranulum pigrum]RAN53802.1 hypothetical protein B8A42_08720 [Dolosigranulum pigrum]